MTDENREDTLSETIEPTEETTTETEIAETEPPAAETEDAPTPPEEDNPEETPSDAETGDSEEAKDGEEAGEPGEEGEEGEEAEEEDGGEEAAVLPLQSVVEAVLFAAREPLKLQNIARAVGKRTRQEAVKEAIDELNVHYLDTGRAFEIAEISGRYQLMSRPEYVSHIIRIYPKKELAEKEKTARLTPSALDTLSIIAYKQPVTRADIERIRGCGCGAVLRALIERGSVKVAGKRMDLTGQPLLYGTTEAFLAEFGLGSIEELPMRNDILSLLGESPVPEPEDEEGMVLELAPIAEADESDEPDEPDDAGDEEDSDAEETVLLENDDNQEDVEDEEEEEDEEDEDDGDDDFDDEEEDEDDGDDEEDEDFEDEEEGDDGEDEEEREDFGDMS